MQSSKFNVYTLWSAESSKSIVEVELGTSTSIYNTEAGWAQAQAQAQVYTILHKQGGHWQGTPTDTHAQSLVCPFRDETHNDPHANCILMRTFVSLFS